MNLIICLLPLAILVAIILVNLSLYVSEERLDPLMNSLMTARLSRINKVCLHVIEDLSVFRFKLKRIAEIVFFVVLAGILTMFKFRGDIPDTTFGRVFLLVVGSLIFISFSLLFRSRCKRTARLLNYIPDDDFYWEFLSLYRKYYTIWIILLYTGCFLFGLSVSFAIRY